MIEYEYMVSPFDEFKDFEEMKKKEAGEYFNWYVNEIYNRINYLDEYIKKDTNSNVSFLDYTPESLMSLWDWFQTKITFVEKTQEEIECEAEEFPKELQYIAYENTQKISIQTLGITTDVANYFAEVIRKNNPSVYWGYFTKPKNQMSVNEPVLLGFGRKGVLNPRLITHNCVWKSLDSKNERMLYDLYYVWLEYIDK